MAAGVGLLGCSREPHLPPTPDAVASTTSTTVLCGRSVSDNVLTAEGDFDGDGRLDQAYERQRGPEPWLLSVCLADGHSDEVEIGSAEGVFYAIDLDGDGRSEIVYGGTSVSQQIDTFAVVLDGRIRLVDEASFAYGLLGSEDTGQDWGCDDLNHDGHRELVQVTVRRHGTGVTWTEEIYRLAGATLTLVTTRTGEAAATGAPWEQAATLVGRCSQSSR
jgi:hypothetical protein